MVARGVSAVPPPYELAASAARPGTYDREDGWMSSKRQQTMAKMTRERKVKERRALKLEKKRAAAEERAADPVEGTPPEPTDSEQTE
jgi:hypothetical protein